LREAVAQPLDILGREVAAALAGGGRTAQAPRIADGGPHTHHTHVAGPRGTARAGCSAHEGAALLHLPLPSLDRFGDRPVPVRLVQDLLGEPGLLVPLVEAVPRPVDYGQPHRLAGCQWQAVEDLAQ